MANPFAPATESDKDEGSDSVADTQEQPMKMPNFGRPTYTFHPELPEVEEEDLNVLEADDPMEVVDVEDGEDGEDEEPYYPPPPFAHDPRRHPWTGQYIGRPERNARAAYDTGVHGPQREERDARPAYVRESDREERDTRAPYESERVQPYTGPVVEENETEDDGWGNVIPENSVDYDQYFNTPDINVPFHGDGDAAGEDFYDKFGVPEDIDIPMPEHEPVYHPHEHADPNAHLKEEEEEDV